MLCLAFKNFAVFRVGVITATSPSSSRPTNNLSKAVQPAEKQLAIIVHPPRKKPKARYLENGGRAEVKGKEEGEEMFPQEGNNEQKWDSAWKGREKENSGGGKVGVDISAELFKQ